MEKKTKNYTKWRRMSNIVKNAVENPTVSALFRRYYPSLCERLVSAKEDVSVLHDVFLKMTTMKIHPQCFYWTAVRLFHALKVSYALDDAVLSERLMGEFEAEKMEKIPA